MDLNESIILQMVDKFVKDGAITYDEFDSLFSILSIKEQYAVTDILYKNGINLVDEHLMDYTLSIDDIDIRQEDKSQLYDDTVFRDVGMQDDEILTINEEIKQSNDILCALIQQGNKQALQDLCMKNKRLVDKYVCAYQKYYGNRLDFEDLEQVGYMGLIKAAQKFDLSQGAAFSTYAVYWIKQTISREIMDNGYAIRIPVHMMERINKVIRLDNSLGGEGYDFYSRLELIADELALSIEEVKECLILKKHYLTYASLNAPVGEDEESELGEFLPQEEALGTDEQVFAHLLREDLESIIATLTVREQKILRLRFGFDDGKVRTLEEIGQMFNVTRERIRQIEAKALRKLRHPSRLRRIKDYIG